MDGCLYVITIIKDFCSFEAIWDLASRWAAATTGCRLSANCPKIVCTDFCNNPETETNAITYHSIRAKNVWTRHRAPCYLDLINSALLRTVTGLPDYKIAEIIIWNLHSFYGLQNLAGTLHYSLDDDDTKLRWIPRSNSWPFRDSIPRSSRSRPRMFLLSDIFSYSQWWMSVRGEHCPSTQITS